MCMRATPPGLFLLFVRKNWKTDSAHSLRTTEQEALIGVIQICSRKFNILAGFSSFLFWKILHQTFHTKNHVQDCTNYKTPKQDFFTYLMHNQNTKFHQKGNHTRQALTGQSLHLIRKKIRKSMQSNKKSLRFIPCRIVHQLVMTQNRKCSVKRRKDVNSPHVCVALLLHEFLYFLLVNHIFISIVLSRFFNDTSFLCQNAKPDVYHLFYQ